jgi:hypothetical protein
MPNLLWYAQSTPNGMPINGRMKGLIEISDSIPQFPLPTQHFALPHRRLCCNRGNGEKCHAELVSASNGIYESRDPETQ